MKSWIENWMIRACEQSVPGGGSMFLTLVFFLWLFNATMSNTTYVNASCITDELYYLAIPSSGTAEEIYVQICVSILLPLSLLSILIGYMFFQLLVGAASAVVAGVALIYALNGAGVSCDVKTWSAPVAATAAFSIGVFMARRAGCLFGIFIGGGIPLVVFTLFPQIATIDTGEIANMKLVGFYVLPVWATVGFSALLIGLILFRYLRVIKMISTSALGSYGVVSGTVLLVVPPANWVLALVMSMTFVIGVASQYIVMRYRTSRDRRDTVALTR
jgi:hypothetical protein